MPRVYSQIEIAAETCTLSDLMIPFCGISSTTSNKLIIFVGIPSRSLPRTTTHFFGKSNYQFFNNLAKINITPFRWISNSQFARDQPSNSLSFSSTTAMTVNSPLLLLEYRSISLLLQPNLYNLLTENGIQNLHIRSISKSIGSKKISLIC